jgi:ABC-2 type transport system ATP-binding protein
MIDIKNLSYRYRGTEHPVFDNFSLQLAEGSIYGLLAPNGVGKSTLLCLIMGGLLPDKGKGGGVQVDGFDVARRSYEVLRLLYLLPEEMELPPVSLSKYVRAREPFYQDFSREVLADCLREFGLPADPDLGTLSMGQRKKVAISFALATRSKYLLLDEPTNGLDIAAKSSFRRVVARHVGDGQTALLSTHQLADVDSLLDHVVVLGQKSEHAAAQLLLDSSVADIAARYTFELHSAASDTDPDVLFCERRADGLHTLAHRHADDGETPVDLELIYKYLHKQ